MINLFKTSIRNIYYATGLRLIHEISCPNGAQPRSIQGRLVYVMDPEIGCIQALRVGPELAVTVSRSAQPDGQQGACANRPISQFESLHANRDQNAAIELVRFASTSRMIVDD
jgi:hypothetical protein